MKTTVKGFKGLTEIEEGSKWGYKGKTIEANHEAMGYYPDAEELAERTPEELVHMENNEVYHVQLIDEEGERYDYDSPYFGSDHYTNGLLERAMRQIG